MSGHGTSIVVSPAFVISITPAQLHITLELLLRAGWPATITVGEPGAHGAAMTGMQGMGVKTPKAAAVADATDGFAIEVHIAKGMIFSIGTLSIMLAMRVVVLTLFIGRNVKELGAVPKLHLIITLVHTIRPIYSISMRIFPGFVYIQ